MFSSHPGLVVPVLVEVECQKQKLQFFQKMSDMVLSNMAVKCPLSDVFSSMHNRLVVDLGKSDPHPELDYGYKFNKLNVLLMAKHYKELSGK